MLPFSGPTTSSGGGKRWPRLHPSSHWASRPGADWVAPTNNTKGPAKEVPAFAAHQKKWKTIIGKTQFVKLIISTSDNNYIIWVIGISYRYYKYIVTLILIFTGTIRKLSGWHWGRCFSVWACPVWWMCQGSWTEILKRGKPNARVIDQ